MITLSIVLTVVNIKCLPVPVPSSTSTRRYFAVAAPIRAKINKERYFIVEKNERYTVCGFLSMLFSQINTVNCAE